MFSARIASFVFLAFGALTTVASPALNAGLAVRADPSDVLPVVNTLKNATETILPQIDVLVSSGTASNDTVTPLVNELIDALNTATASLSTMSARSIFSKRQASDDDVANLVAEIVTDISNTLTSLVGSVGTGIIPLGGLDTALAQVLNGLEVLLAGVLNLVATLLVDVAGLLRSLAFGLTLASLGLS